MDRDTRRLSHNKGNKIITQSSIPLSSDGEDGDQRVVGTKLYTKSDGKWFAIDSEAKSDGWHGSTKVIKVLPTEFISNTTTAYADYTGGDARLRFDPKWNGTSHSAYAPYQEGYLSAAVSIPFGYRVFKYVVYGLVGGSPTGTIGRTIIVEGTRDTGVFGDIVLTQPQYPLFGTEATLSTAIVGSDKKYIYVSCLAVRGGGIERVYGAKCFIEPV